MVKKQQTISKAHLGAARAVDALRRQLGIVIQEDSGKPLGACPIEGLTPELLKALTGRLSLLLTGARAKHLGLPAKSKAVRLDAAGLSFEQLTAMADPLQESSLPKVTAQTATPTEELLMHMAKHASLLPALLLVEEGRLPEEWVSVAGADAAAYWAEPMLDIVPLAKASLPVAGVENASIIAYRERYGTSVHLAVIIGQPGDNPLTRVHSSCITGDILGSLRCDCGEQLSLAMATLKQAGGVLIYLHQEGRGIGIANKLRAYQLQERGVDTYEANLMLGFEEDERDFTIASAILKQLGIKQIRLLSNNPQKIAALENAGIKVSERVALSVKSGKHNHEYLDAKARKSGHLL